MSEKEKKGWALVITFIGALLGSGVIASWILPTAWSTLYVSPNFEIVVPPGLSSVKVRNTGHAAALNAKICIRVPGNQTLAFTFSTENSTASTSYCIETNATLFTFQLKRMAEHALVLATLKSYAGQTLEVWIHSDQRGAYVLAKRGSGAGQPIEDLFGKIVLGVLDNLTSVWYYVTLFILLAVSSWFMRIDYRQLWRKQRS